MAISTSTSLKRNASHLSGPAVDSKKPKANSSITSFFGVPKPKTDAAQASTLSSRFNKEKWVASLTAEQKDLLKLEIETLDDSWLAHLKDEIVTPEFLSLKRFLKKEKESGATIFPPENEIYSWSRHTPLHTVKAVIIGQDPYHNYNQAHGLCFSVRPPTPAPPSLQNIYIALKNDYPSFEPPPKKGGLLTPWAERGVLMLNTCLTVRAHAANSHSGKGWERFTQKAIDTVARVRTHGVVFLAWGTPAGKRVSGINRERHCVLQSVHPSPLSARNGFFTCGHFKKCNDWLAERYGEDGRIDWSLTPGKTVLGPTASPDEKDTSVSANGQQGGISTQSSSAAEKTNGEMASTNADKNDLLADEDDLDALEALIAVEESLKSEQENSADKPKETGSESEKK
ncbi:hypothetical protein VTN77DRAFT_9928 [Rasamsonia byssochlamydoides]|uniref:uncharacterized protein n=1 Tax=Rasamsonia byssochlamydoides TaxID=89139 RepID=UPI0037431BA2